MRKLRHREGKPSSDPSFNHYFYYKKRYEIVGHFETRSENFPPTSCKERSGNFVENQTYSTALRARWWSRITLSIGALKCIMHNTLWSLKIWRASGGTKVHGKLPFSLRFFYLVLSFQKLHPRIPATKAFILQWCPEFTGNLGPGVLTWVLLPRMGSVN